MRANTALVRVELFGVPRLLTGAPDVEVPGATLAELSSSLLAAAPQLAGQVIDRASGWINEGYIFVVDGRFSRDPDTAVPDDAAVLLVSSVAGG